MSARSAGTGRCREGEGIVEEQYWARMGRLSRRRFLASTGAIGTGVALAACGSSGGSAGKSGAGGTAPAAASTQPVRGGTLTLGLMNDIANLDPLPSSLVVDRRVQYQ